MKIIFIGAVEIGYTVLECILGEGYAVDTIFSLPDTFKEKTSGFVNFKKLANTYNCQLIETHNINDELNINKIINISPDLIIVCGWQRLICQEIIEIPKLGTIGFHSSLLPKYRGRAPVNWAIIMGEKETGITMFYLTKEADDGDIIAQNSFLILFNDDAKTIYEKSAIAGQKLIKEYLPKIKNNTAPRMHNPSGTYPAYPKRTPKDGLIDFNRSSLDVYNFVRALTKPYPGAYYLNERNEKVIIWKIEIIFDDKNINAEDVIFNTLDFKMRVIL